MPTAAQLRARWPEALPATFDAGNVATDAAIVEAYSVVANVGALGQRLEEAVSYLAMHLLVSFNRSLGTAGGPGGGGGTIAGPVASMAAGAVSVSFGSFLGGGGSGGSPTSAQLASTPFGARYLEILNARIEARFPVLL